MKTPPYFEKMHSGDRCIVLEESVSYESFASVAERWAKTLELKVVSRADGLDARVWSCTRNGKAFWLSFDHWFTTISLDPKDDCSADEIVMIGTSMGIDFQNSAET